MTEHTPEQLALARKIVARHYQSIRDHDYAGWVLKGEKDRIPGMAIALAAIVETTELAMKLAADHVDQCEDTARGRARNATAKDIYDALRSYAHLEDPSHADG